MAADKTILRREILDARDELLNALEHLSESDWQKPAPPEGWTVRDVLAHLAANQPSQPVLIRNILDGKGGSRADFNLDFYNKRGLEKRQDKSLDELKSELAAGHTDTLTLLDSLGDEQLAVRGRHPRGEMSVADIFRIIAIHDREHTAHIRTALASKGSPPMLLWVALGFLAGWLINIASDAWPAGKPFGAPACTYCGTPRPPTHWSAVPAYLLRQSRCRNCGRRIALRWPLVEIGSTLLCAALFYLLGPTPRLVIVTLYSLSLLLICIMDFEHRLILNRVIYPAIGAALFLSFVDPGTTPLNAILGGVIGFALTGLIYLGGKLFVQLQARSGRIIDELAFGDGDVMLMLFIGLITGVPQVIGALLLGILMGGVAALAIILYGALRRESKLFVPFAYGPYLALAGWIVLMQAALTVPPL